MGPKCAVVGVVVRVLSNLRLWVRLFVMSQWVCGAQLVDVVILSKVD